MDAIYPHDAEMDEANRKAWAIAVALRDTAELIAAYLEDHDCLSAVSTDDMIGIKWNLTVGADFLMSGATNPEPNRDYLNRLIADSVVPIFHS